MIKEIIYCKIIKFVRAIYFANFMDDLKIAK